MQRPNKLAVSPGQVSVLGRQVETAYQQGQLLQAEALCLEIMRISRNNPEAGYMLARIALDLGDFDKATARLGKAMESGRNDFRLWLLQGNLCARTGKLEEAQKNFARVTRLAPMESAGWQNLATALLELGRFAEAEKAARTAAGLSPINPDVQNGLAQALLEQEKFAEAEPMLIALLARFPRHGGILKNLCAAYVLQNKLDEVRQLITDVDLAQADAESIKAVAAILRKTGELDLVDKIVEHASQVYPQDLSWKVAYSEIAFARAQYALGWQCYEAREAGLPQTRWEQDLTGQEIHLYSDQGLGDDVFFWRYLPALQERGAKIVYAVSAKLLPLARRLPCVGAVTELDRAVTIGQNVAQRIPISSVPFLSGQGLQAAYPEAARVTVLPEKQAAVQQMLRQFGSGPYLGLTLRGGRPLHEVGGLRKLQIYSKVIGLDEIAGVLKEWPGQIVWLQFKPLPGELAGVSQALGREVLDMSDLNDDLESMLALLDKLDEYVTVSNTNVHLRTMLGKPSQVLVPMPPEFRWARAGEETVWFPGTKVYRQLPGGGWEEAIKQLEVSLRKGFSPGE